jgi:hypothetical protein
MPRLTLSSSFPFIIGLDAVYLYGFSKVDNKGRSHEAYSHPQFRRDDKDQSVSLGRNKVGDRRRKRLATSTIPITTPAISNTTGIAVSSSSVMPFFAGLTPQQQDQLLPLQFSSPLISTQQFSSHLAAMERLDSFLKQQQQQHLTQQDMTTSCNTWDANLEGSTQWEAQSQSQQQPHYHQKHEQQQVQPQHQQQQRRLSFDPLSHQLPSLPHRHHHPPDERRHSIQQQIFPSPHHLPQSQSMLTLPQYSQDDASPIVSTISSLQHRPQPQEDFPPIPHRSALMMNVHTRMMSQSDRPSSLSAQQDMILLTEGGDWTGTALGSEQQDHGQEDHPRRDVLEPRSIEEMIARPLQRRRHQQDDGEDDIDVGR